MDPYDPQQPIMPPPPPDTDETQLRLLAIFHYVVSGINCLGALFGLIYVVLGIAVLMGWEDGSDPAAPGEEAFLGVFFLILGGTFTLCTLTFAGLVAYAGLNIHRQQRWGYCFGMAIATCASMVFCACGIPNLVLGIFSLILLLRPSVKAKFGMPA